MEHFSNVNTLLLGEKMAPLAVTHDLPPGRKTTAFLSKFPKFNCDQHYLDARFLVNYIPRPAKNTDLVAAKIRGGGLPPDFFQLWTGVNDVASIYEWKTFDEAKTCVGGLALWLDNMSELEFVGHVVF